MPRAKPPPKARPMAGTRFASATALAVRDRSRPKACMERITLARRFTGPNSWFAAVANRLSTYIRCHEPALRLEHHCASRGYRRIRVALLEFQYAFAK